MSQEVADRDLIKKNAGIAKITGVEKSCLGFKSGCALKISLKISFKFEFLDVLLNFTVLGFSKEPDLKHLFLQHFVAERRIVLHNFNNAFSTLINTAKVSQDLVSSSLCEPIVVPALDIYIGLPLFGGRILKAKYKIAEFSVFQSIFGEVFVHTSSQNLLTNKVAHLFDIACTFIITDLIKNVNCILCISYFRSNCMCRFFQICRKGSARTLR